MLEVGQVQTVIGTGFDEGETVAGTMFSDPADLGTQVADSDGEVTFTWTIADGTDLGAHSVTLEGTDSGSVSGDFRVVAAGAAGGAGGSMLPATGVDTGWAVPAGFALLLLGIAGYLLSRRKMTA